MAPTSCFTGQVHRLPDAPEAYGAMITRAKAAPAQSRSTDLCRLDPPDARENSSPLVRKQVSPTIQFMLGDFNFRHPLVHTIRKGRKDLKSVVT